MMTVLRHTTVAAALLAAVAPASAQSRTSPFIDVAGFTREGTAASTTPLQWSIAPGILIERPWTSAYLSGETQVANGVVKVAAIDASWSAMTPRVWALRGELYGTARFDRTQFGEPVSAGGVQARLHAALGAAGIWAGGGANGVSTEYVDRAAPVVAFGAWMRRRGVTVSGDVTRSSVAGVFSSTRPPDSLSFVGDGTTAPTPTPNAGSPSSPPSRFESTQHAWSRATGDGTRARLGLQWSGTRYEVNGFAGTWIGGSALSRPWAHINATYWLNSRFAFVAGAGWRARDVSIGEMRSSDASLGLRLSRAPMPTRVAPIVTRAFLSGFSVARDAEGVQLIVHAPGAGRVEVSGDLTQWSATRLRRASGDAWSLTLPLTPGIYHVNIRIDGGEWTPPPGLPTSADGYSGVTGVLVIE